MPPIIDSDGHVRGTDEQMIEYMSSGYQARRKAMLYFPLLPHHGWHRSIPQNDFREQDFRVPDWREWAEKLDEGEIELAVLYPTRFMHIGQVGSPQYAEELCRAYNDFLHDQFPRFYPPNIDRNTKKKQAPVSRNSWPSVSSLFRQTFAE